MTQTTKSRGPDINRHKTYLGDAVYVQFDGYGIALTTEDGIKTTNRIVLEPEVLEALMRWCGERDEPVSSDGSIPASES